MVRHWFNSRHKNKVTIPQKRKAADGPTQSETVSRFSFFANLCRLYIAKAKE